MVVPGEETEQDAPVRVSGQVLRGITHSPPPNVQRRREQAAFGSAAAARAGSPSPAHQFRPPRPSAVPPSCLSLPVAAQHAHPHGGRRMYRVLGSLELGPRKKHRNHQHTICVPGKTPDVDDTKLFETQV